MHPRNAAFTLIELLIVVAIIAILAAIAVPNFLEAQVRSKVSRAKSDMRSVAVALESYAVDANQYPPHIVPGHPNADPLSLVPFIPFIDRLRPLTTPVAYLTSILEDPFAKASVDRDPGAASWGYRIPATAAGVLTRPYPFDYASRGAWERLYGVAGTTIWITAAKLFSSYPDSIEWAMRSIGPDLVGTVLGSDNPPVYVYDPTNGTLSQGDIYFSGPGVGIDSGRK